MLKDEEIRKERSREALILSGVYRALKVCTGSKLLGNACLRKKFEGQGIATATFGSQSLSLDFIDWSAHSRRSSFCPPLVGKGMVLIRGLR